MIYLVGESHFLEGLDMVAVTDLRCLTVTAKTESIVDKVSANIPSKQPTQFDNLHIILRNKCFVSPLSGFKITEALVNSEYTRKSVKVAKVEVVGGVICQVNSVNERDLTC